MANLALSVRDVCEEVGITDSTDIMGFFEMMQQDIPERVMAAVTQQELDSAVREVALASSYRE